MVTKNEILDYLKMPDDVLYEKANKIRQDYVGEGIHLRGLVEFSNICRNNCKYCGLRCNNKLIKRYRIEDEDIISIAKQGVKLGLKTIVLQSGEDSYFNQDRLCKIIEEIKKLDVAVTLSTGEKTYKEYKAYKDAGADRYLLRIETTDKKLYKALHPKMSYENRIECLYNLKDIGYETGTGCLVGLPNQTLESLANDILFFSELNADMIGIGPFIPHPDTPLGNCKVDLNKNFYLSLKVMAVTRITLKNINIPATTAMETICLNGRKIALQSGANVIMPNITDAVYKKEYEIYPNKFSDNNVLNSLSEIETMALSIGRTIL